MGQYTHKGQILPLVNQMIPIDKTTTFHASYDHHLNGMNQEEIVKPVGMASTLLVTKDSGHIEFTPISFAATDSWTVEITAREVDSSGTVFFLGDNTSSVRAVGFLNAGFNFRADDGTYVGQYSVARREWNTLAVSYQNGKLVFYNNGKLLGENTHSTPAVFNSIGSGYTNNSYKFGGNISNVRIWNRALSQEEIKSRLDREITGKEEGLIAYYKLTEKEGPIAFDYSGSGNDGMWNGSIVSVHGTRVAVLTEGRFSGGVRIEEDSSNLLKSNAWGRDTTDVTIVHDPRIKGVVQSPVYRWSGSTKSGMGNCYLNGTSKIDQTIFSNTWTFSCYLRREDGQPVTSVGSVYIYADAQDDGLRISTNKAPTGIEDCGNGWYRVWRTEVLSKSASISLCGFSSLDKSIDWYMNGWQLERTKHPTSHMDINQSRAKGKLEYTSSIFNPLSYTVGCFVKFDNVDNTTHQTVMEVDDATGGVTTRFLLFLEHDKFKVLNGATDTQYVVTGTTMVERKRWYHIIATYDGTTLKLYVDGALEGSVASAPPSFGDGKMLAVGGWRWKSLNGIIDELRIESRAISAEEAAAWAASGLHYNYLDYSTYVD